MSEAVTSKRAEALERFERAVELPLLILALLMLPLLMAPLLLDFPSGVESTLLAVDWFIWGVFALEFVVRLVLSERRVRFVGRNWVDLVIIALPFLRPLRVVRSARALRLLRLARLATFLGAVGKEGSRLLRRHQLHYVLLVTFIAVLGAAGLVFALEDQGGGSIDSFGDSLWWAITTVTTVGYGDTFPVAPAGRGVAAVLMVSGIALFGVLTANVAAFLIEEEGEETVLGEKLDEVLSRLDAIERRMDRVEP